MNEDRLADWEGVEARISSLGIRIGVPICIVHKTASTSDDAKSAARAGARHGATWVAEEQTKGRGRQGRAWQSAKGESILVSILLRTTVSPERVAPLSLVAGLVVRDAVEHATAAPNVRVKWPNDVLIGERKVAGILVETLLSGGRVEAVIVGIGLNVHARAFADDLTAKATSMGLETDRELHRSAILADILQRLDRESDLVLHRGLGPFRARLEKADALKGKRVTRDDGVSGIASGIDDTGGLRVAHDNGAIAVWSSGEVHLVAPVLDGRPPPAGR